jgi:hypothetical protein
MNARNLGVVFGRKLILFSVIAIKLTHFSLSDPDEIV